MLPILFISSFSSPTTTEALEEQLEVLRQDTGKGHFQSILSCWSMVTSSTWGASSPEMDHMHRRKQTEDSSSLKLHYSCLMKFTFISVRAFIW